MKYMQTFFSKGKAQAAAQITNSMHAAYIAVGFSSVDVYRTFKVDRRALCNSTR